MYQYIIIKINRQMQQESHDLFFNMFEKRRLKVAQIQKNRREDIFNKSRQLLQSDDHNSETNQILSTNKGEDNYQDQLNSEDSSLNVESSQDSIFNFMKNEESIDGLENKSKSIQTQMKIQGQSKKQIQTPKTKNKHRENRKYAKIMQVPTWMNQVPQQLHNFYGMARPFGRAGLLVFKQAGVHLFDKTGRTIIPNILPTKCHAYSKLCQSQQGTILQMVYNEQTNSIFITDLLYWKHNILTADNFQFRYAWLLSNFAQIANAKIPNLNIKLVEYFLMDSHQNLNRIYSGTFGYEKEGLLFVQKQSPYIHGFNQNVLIWKDSATSEYPVDQQSGKGNQKKDKISKCIYGTGKYSKQGNIYSLEGYKIGKMNPILIPGAKNGYIRFRLSSIVFDYNSQKQSAMNQQKLVEVQNEHGQGINIALRDFEPIQYKKYSRVDPLSRILFQYRARYDPLTIDKIASRITSK